MKIYKLSIKNKDLQFPFDGLYFEEQRTAVATMSAIDQMLVEGKTIEWECEIIQVMGHREAFDNLISAIKLL